MKSLEGGGPSEMIITSPFAGVVVYSLLDAFRIVVAHERPLRPGRRVIEADFHRVSESAPQIALTRKSSAYGKNQ